MANTSSAQKAERASQRKHVFNVRRKKAVHDALRALQKAPSAAAFSTFQQAVDKAAKTNVITKNTAARMKSRLTKRLATLSAAK
ncbi:MAG TPA: 30S ribosomal protein S20 [Candidatus Paceibacterota bacterium]